jgi:quercetin dioxygenase-like cupin family protein
MGCLTDSVTAGLGGVERDGNGCQGRVSDRMHARCVGRDADRMSGTTPLANLYRDKLARVEACHGGAGHAQVFRPFERAEHGPRVDFVDLAIIPPGCEIGRHRHGDDEECYVVLRGEATMFLDGASFAVRAGDIVPNRRFGEHGLVNDSDQDVHLFVIQTSSGS